MASENSIDSPKKKNGRAEIDDAKFDELMRKGIEKDRKMLEEIGRL